MTHTTVAANVTKPRNVLGNLPTQLTFDDVIFIQQRREAGQLVFLQFAGTHLGIDPGGMTQLTRRTWPDAVQVRQRDHRRTIVRNVDTK